MWFKAEYEYDSKKFNSSCGVLYVNGSKCSWSDIYNRWEIQISNTATGVKKYIVSGVVDNVYDLKIINTEIGLVSINHFISYAIYVIIIMMIIFIIIFIASRIRNKINLPR